VIGKQEEIETLRTVLVHKGEYLTLDNRVIKAKPCSPTRRPTVRPHWCVSYWPLPAQWPTHASGPT